MARRTLTATALALALAKCCAVDHAYAATRSEYRLGIENKRTSIAILTGSSLVSGDRSGLGANGFSATLGADSLYGAPKHLALEYGEHTKRTSLTFGLVYTQVTATESLRTALAVDSGSSLTLTYFDTPITYHVNVFPAGDSPFNLFAGLSLIPMVDIATSTAFVFEDGSGAPTESSASSTGGLSNKHVDFGLGFGGEIGIEQRVAGNVFLTGRVGFRRPFTGVTRPDFGFFLTGIRIYQ